MLRLRPLLAVLLLAVGCVSSSSQRLAELSERENDWDQAVLHYLELVQEFIATDPLAPRRAELLNALQRAGVALG